MIPCNYFSELLLFAMLQFWSYFKLFFHNIAFSEKTQEIPPNIDPAEYLP
jgi:hypothetical protein